MSTATLPLHAGPATSVVILRGRSRWPRVVLLLVLVTVAASYSAVSVPAALSERGASADRAAALSVAQKGAAALLSYDYRDTERSLARMQRYAVPALANRLEQTWPSMRGDIVFGRAVTESRVKAAAVESLAGGTALVLVYLDQTTRTKKAPATRTTPFRISVTVQQVHGRWLVAKVQPE